MKRHTHTAQQKDTKHHKAKHMFSLYFTEEDIMWSGQPMSTQPLRSAEVMNDYRGVLSAYQYGDSYLVLILDAWGHADVFFLLDTGVVQRHQRFRTWTLRK